ncbi:ferritin-like domain-containing protein [Kitasatospora sp. NPDC059599]|uniref:ferritin-like domain-containing protein n=1 Tax=Kitasatospora sp. NPDC059599 TaxID=3346880 RepID=UPI0036AE83CF
MQPPSRRTLLSLGLFTLTACTVAACTTDRTGPAPGATGPRPDPDAPVRLRAVTATDALLTGYDTLPAPPGVDGAGLRAETARHRAALAEGLPATAVPSPPVTTGPTTGAPPTTATTGPATAAAPTPATDGLAALELRTAESHLADLDAAGPSLARLLASLAAAHTLHAAALGAPAPPLAAPPTASASANPAATPGEAPGVGAAAVTALQNALGAEHAAVYGYGVVGARLPDDPARTDARTAYAAHQARRDTWQRLITSLGAAPAPAAAGYQLPFPVASAADATRLAAHLETRLTGVYADLVAAVPAPHRLTAALALRDCALRARRWGAPDQPFPGVPDPAATPAATTG